MWEWIKWIANRLWCLLPSSQCVDATELLKKCEEERDTLKRSHAEKEAELATFHEMTVIGTIEVSRIGLITFANENAAAITGYSVNELSSMRLFELVPYHSRAMHNQAFLAVANRERPVPSGIRELELRTKDGADTPILLKIVPNPHGSDEYYRVDFRKRIV